MPFSDIFFNQFAKQWLADALRQIKSSKYIKNKSGQSELLKIVAVNMINKSIEETGEGHYHYIISGILHDIYKIYALKNMYDQMDYNILAYNVLVDYVHEVLIKYVDENGKFNDVDYFYSVFNKNADIWGFLLAYVPIIEFGSNKFHPDIINTVCRLLLKYCFSTEFATKPIKVNELVEELQTINLIINDLLAPTKKNKLSLNSN
jgi:hypothetical protein